MMQSRKSLAPGAAASIPAGDPPKPARAPMRWKLVLAADEPWSGSIYPTRRGRAREVFHTPEEMICAVMRLTGWQWPTTRSGTAVDNGAVSGEPTNDRDRSADSPSISVEKARVS